MTWSTERTGDFLITAWLEGCTVGGCAKACAVEPGALDASRCACSGEGLARAVAGQRACFGVDAHDLFGNARAAGGDEVAVRVAKVGEERGAAVSGHVEDLGGGRYQVITCILLPLSPPQVPTKGFPGIINIVLVTAPMFVMFL